MKSDYRIIIVSAAALVCLAGLFFLVDGGNAPVLTEKPVDSAAVEVQTDRKPYYSEYDSNIQQLQAFDPNTADSALLLRLGIPEWTVRSIYKYRAKGGVFATAEDFGRMHGITLKLYKQLLPYIRIADDYKPAAEFLGEREPRYKATVGDTVDYPEKMAEGEVVSINSADTTMLKTVPGIGSYYARRIVELRNRYGGFVSLDQLLDIKGFPEEALRYLTIPDGGITKINLNTANFKTLQSHPYIGYSRAKAVTDYRRLKGRITSLRQLSLLPGFGEEELSRLEPYVEF